jgi:hypothetical protein
MPIGLEMSPLARELLALILERWRTGKRDRRSKELLSSRDPLSEDEYRAAEANVLEKQHGLFQWPHMSKAEAIKQVVLEARGNTKAKITVDKLTDFIEGKIGFDKRERSFGKRKRRKKASKKRKK